MERYIVRNKSATYLGTAAVMYAGLCGENNGRWSDFFVEKTIIFATQSGIHDCSCP